MLETQEAQKRKQLALAASSRVHSHELQADQEETLVKLTVALLGPEDVTQHVRKLPGDLRLGRIRPRSERVVTGLRSYMTHERALALRVAEIEAELKRKYETAIEAAQPGGISLKVIEQAAIANLKSRTIIGESRAESTGKSLSTRAPVRRDAASLLCKGDFWIVGYQGEEALIKHGKGLCHIAYLLRYPDREIHTLDLTAYSGAYRRSEASEEAPRECSNGGTPRNNPSSSESFTISEEVLDRRARAAFKARFGEIEEALEQAKSAGDEERAIVLENEAQALKRELVRMIGPGCRIRRLETTGTERVRLNVTRAIWSAVGRIERAAPALGQHLGSHIRTGLYCRYRIDHESPVNWNI